MDCLKKSLLIIYCLADAGLNSPMLFVDILNTYASVLFFYIFAGLRGMRIGALIKKIFFKEI